jgi:hypothetical protein
VRESYVVCPKATLDSGNFPTPELTGRFVRPWPGLSGWAGARRLVLEERLPGQDYSAWGAFEPTPAYGLTPWRGCHTGHPVELEAF